jgi:hypothetical protein
VRVHLASSAHMSIVNLACSRELLATLECKAQLNRFLLTSNMDLKKPTNLLLFLILQVPRILFRVKY